MALNYENYQELTLFTKKIPGLDPFLSKNYFSKVLHKSSVGKVVLEKEAFSHLGIAKLAEKNARANVLAKTGSKEAFVFELPMTKEVVPFSVYEYEQMKAPLGKFINVSDADRTSQWDDYVAKHMKLLKERTERKYEVMCGQALTTGKIGFTEGGTTWELDFGFEDDVNLIELTNTDLWSNAAADIVEQLITWITDLQIRSGMSVGSIIMGKEAAKALRASEKYQKKLGTLNYPVGKIEPYLAIAKGWGATAWQQINGIPIYIYSQKYKDESGTLTDIFDPKKIVLLADNNPALGKVQGIMSRFKDGDSFQMDMSAVEYLAMIDKSKDKSYAEYQLNWSANPMIFDADGITSVKVLV